MYVTARNLKNNWQSLTVFAYCEKPSPDSGGPSPVTMVFISLNVLSLLTGIESDETFTDGMLFVSQPNFYFFGILIVGARNTHCAYLQISTIKDTYSFTQRSTLHESNWITLILL
jgi:hypothetical protein